MKPWRERWFGPDDLENDDRPMGAKFIRCAWCLGAWIALGWWLAWLIWPHASVVVAVPFALSAIVGLVHRNLD